MDDDTGPLPALPEKRTEEFGRRLGQVFAAVVVLALSAVLLVAVWALVMHVLGYAGPGDCP